MKVACKILASEPWVSPDNKRFVTISGLMFGTKIFKMTVKEELIPDSLEGKECTAIFAIGIDRKFKPYLRLKGFEA